MIIATNRLVIRDFVLEDWMDVHSYASDADVTKYMIWGPNTEKDTNDFIQRTIAMQQQQLRIDFELAVVLKETNTLIGGSGIHITEPNIGEIGYCFNPLYWQKGYASEAAAALTHYGFKTLGLHRIYATCRPENIGSAKVMEKTGMQREGRLREHVWHKDKWHDSFLYSILAHEWTH
jgi:ribosomal-protein-alanine N-acetyltransferase